jgi:hypothetical protein
MSIIKLTNLMSDNYEVLWSNIINPVQPPQHVKGSFFCHCYSRGQHATVVAFRRQR